MMRLFVFLFILLIVHIKCAFTVFAAADPALNLTVSEKEWLADHPVIKTPTTLSFEMPPIYTHDPNGKYAGVGVDIAELVGRKLGVKIEWIDYENQVTAIDALMNGDVDFVSFMGENMPGEGTFYVLSNFFHQFPTTLVVPKSSSGKITANSLRGKRIAAVRYWPDTEFIKDNYPDITVVEVGNALEALQKVAFGEVDAAAIILPIAAYEIRAGGITTLRIGGKLDRVFRQGFGIRADWPELTRLVNKALAAMTEQEKTELYNKWVPVLVTDDVNYRKWLYRIGLVSLIFFIVFCGVLYWNRKLSLANQAERQARTEARRKAEEALDAKRRMERAVEEEQMLRKKQVRFVDMISHECRTPVAVLQANLDILQLKQRSGAEPGGKNYENMQYAITRLTELLDSGLDKVQLENGDILLTKKMFGLHGCLQEVVEHISSLWPDRKIKYSYLTEELLNMEGDRQLIKTALLNLMENGLKYSPVEEKLNIILDEDSGNAVVRVLDRGIGIPDAEKKQVFEKYYRSDRGVDVSGTGVGLFLVKRTVELHGGSIAVEDRPRGGIVMTVVLPLDKR